jgi:hypothetical protein
MPAFPSSEKAPGAARLADVDGTATAGPALKRPRRRRRLGARSSRVPAAELVAHFIAVALHSESAYVRAHPEYSWREHVRTLKPGLSLGG